MDAIILNDPVLTNPILVIAGIITGIIFWKIVEKLYDLLRKKE